MAGSARHLIGPAVLLGLCSKDLRAVDWAETVQEADCVLSRLAVAIARSVIDGAESELERQSWQRALDTTVARMEAGGAILVDLNETILDKFHLYRTCGPLEFTTRNGVESLPQDVRLLITTAAVMDLVYTDYADRFMEQLPSVTGVKVCSL